MREILNAVIGSLVLMSVLGGCSGNQMERYDNKSSEFLDCPDTPNCVSSLAKDPKNRIEPFRLKEEPESSWNMVKKTVASLPRTKIITANATDIHAECSSMIFRFVDDLMLHLIPSSGIIHIRSASRTGYFDLGVNRDRIEDLRKKLRKKDIIE